MFFFFKQKTAYEMRISDWSSDVCSSDLNPWNFSSRVMRRPDHRITLLEKFQGLRPPPNDLVDRCSGHQCVLQHFSSFRSFKTDPKIGRATCRERLWQYV